MAFNSKYYIKGNMLQLLPAASAFSTYVTSDNILIGMFQGKRGQNPLLDFKVRILFDGKDNTPILPPHSYWVVDLMLKCVEFSKEVSEIANYYLDFYNNCIPFATQQARINYTLQTRTYINETFGHIDLQNTLSLDYVAIIIELFCLNEKQTTGAYMFRNLLTAIHDYANGSTNYVQLLEATKPGFR